MEGRMISNGKTKVITELSDSTSSTHALPRPPSKRARHASIVNTTRFKGVVPQHNGNWGAQIYANHHRMWLGTFRSEKEAAMAYDSAAIRLRSNDSHRNIPWTSITAHEPHFQSRYPTEVVLNMIRDGSYEFKFAEFLRSYSKSGEKDGNLTQMRSPTDRWLMCKQLFQKELTPSDVGKLNRLVIPKKYALKYLPSISEGGGEEGEKSDYADDVQLVFYDRSMRMWKFRYCYWKSSQSFVFTRGWNRFVKDNQLKHNDTISFYMCKCRDNNSTVTKTFCMIYVNKGENNNGSLVGMSNIQYGEMQVPLHLPQGKNVIHVGDEGKADGDEEKAEEEESTKQSPKREGELKKPFRLFGDEEKAEEEESTKQSLKHEGELEKPFRLFGDEEKAEEEESNKQSPGDEEKAEEEESTKQSRKRSAALRCSSAWPTKENGRMRAHGRQQTPCSLA
ncbi:hypothetical protein Dsin_029264 [Dipteronia sinensis]|uniref:Uncharacterized protein n=1 Tax=Dipteronia sinensis TaxID=43782 RepID=A0AAD9ZS12_9ROSI|nr:hypothetical protein Dsin_029264 [Dipteronia sinensis]